MNTKEQTSVETLERDLRGTHCRIDELLRERDQIIHKNKKREKVLLDIMMESLKRERIACQALEDLDKCAGEWFQGTEYKNNGDPLAGDVQAIAVNALMEIDDVKRGEF